MVELEKPLKEEDFLPVARRILTESDPNLPPLEERIATLLFQMDGTKYSNRLNYRARIDAEIRSGALVLAIREALVEAEEGRWDSAIHTLRMALVGK